jgi:hypothetical protein
MQQLGTLYQRRRNVTSTCECCLEGNVVGEGVSAKDVIVEIEANVVKRRYG